MGTCTGWGRGGSVLGWLLTVAWAPPPGCLTSPASLKAGSFLFHSWIYFLPVREGCGWRSTLSPAMFHYENWGKLGERLRGLAPEGLRPLLPWSRRGGVPPRACLLVRGWQKFKLVKSGLVPRGGEKKGLFPPPPPPGRGADWPSRRAGPPSPGAPRPHPQRSATPPSGQERGPDLNERNSATLIGLGLDAAPRGRRGAEDGTLTCDSPPSRKMRVL